MDTTTIITTILAGFAGVISALVYIYKSKEKTDRENLDFLKGILEKAIAVIERENILSQDLREELKLSQNERKESNKTREWCRTVLNRFMKINDIDENILKEGEE